MSSDTSRIVGPSARFSLGPVDLIDCTVDEATDIVADAARDGRSVAIHLCNAYTVSLAAHDHRYAGALAECSVNLVDGTPVSWFYRLLTRRPARSPVRGADLMRAALDRPGLRHYLYGGSPEVLASLLERLAVEHPTAVVVGSEAPPFRELADEEVVGLVDDLRRTGAQICWVGLGTPKQDYLLADLARREAGVSIGVGAAFDFLSGQKREAPAFLHGTGLEWAHRLVTEPRRLWRRYLWGNLGFLRLAARELRTARAGRSTR